MDGQQRRASGGRKRRRSKSKAEPKTKVEPVLIVARRPDSPRLTKGMGRAVAASAQPKRVRSGVIPEAAAALEMAPVSPAEADRAVDKPRRVARIAAAQGVDLDDQARLRERLLNRLLQSEGRSAISLAVDELLRHEFAVPEEQDAQLQLLEHVNETYARQAICVMERLLRAEPPFKRPILEQRLRRLEEEADEAETRLQAAALRKRLRAA